VLAQRNMGVKFMLLEFDYEREKLETRRVAENHENQVLA